MTSIIMMESGPEPGESQGQSGSERRDSSSDDESIVKMMMKDAADKRAGRESRRKDIDTIFRGKLGGLNLNGADALLKAHSQKLWKRTVPQFTVLSHGSAKVSRQSSNLSVVNLNSRMNSPWTRRRLLWVQMFSTVFYLILSHYS
jgi:hypothetical protein